MTTPTAGPMVAITRRFTFSAAHRYAVSGWSDTENQARYGPLARMHGHTYTLEVTVRGPVDPCTGMVMDLAELTRRVGDAVVSRFDHSCLNDDPAFPAEVVPTTENLARVIWDRLVVALGEGGLDRIRLWEDPTLCVEYRGQA